MNAFEDHIQWNAVKEVGARLKEAGHEALLAGGCVRDLIMHRAPNDFDVATSATPDQIEALFPNAILVGKAFGVIIVPFGDFQIEVATFREDLEYKDGRRPEGVKFSTPKADAQRRDFTINALFYDLETKKIIDYVDGQTDISAKIIRTVGDPNHRFDEDKLRILRALRFSAQLGFEIEKRTFDAIVERASEVSVVSQERIRDEILKLLKSKDRVKGLRLLLETKVLDGAMPTLAAAIRKREAAWLEAFDKLEEPIDDLTTLFALFVWPSYNLGFSAASKSAEIQPTAGDAREFEEKILRGFRFTNELVASVAGVLKNLGRTLNPSGQRMGELASLFTKPYATSLLHVADTLVRANALPHEEHSREKWNEALKAARPDGFTPAQPLATGKDLIKFGLKPGPMIGQVLQDFYVMQLEGKLTSLAQIEEIIRARRTQD